MENNDLLSFSSSLLRSIVWDHLMREWRKKKKVNVNDENMREWERKNFQNKSNKEETNDRKSQTAWSNNNK